MREVARKSDVDSKRFGVRVFRADVADEREAEALVAFSRGDGADLVIARAPVEQHAAIATLERAGFFLCDTLVRWSASTESFAVTEGVRDATAADAPAIRAIALASFRDYPSHYHADPRLDRAAIAEGYAEWAANAQQAL